MRTDEFLDVEARPTMTFRSTSITGDGDDWTVVGELTIGAITKPSSLSVELGGIEEFPGSPATPASTRPASCAGPTSASLRRCPPRCSAT